MKKRQGAKRRTHFVNVCKTASNREIGENLVENGNLAITTTLDSDIQEKTEEVITKEFENSKTMM